MSCEERRRQWVAEKEVKSEKLSVESFLALPHDFPFYHP